MPIGGDAGWFECYLTTRPNQRLSPDCFVWIDRTIYRYR